MADSELKAKREIMKSYYKQHGCDALTDVELLELALTVSLPIQNGKQTAQQLISRYKSIKNILLLSSQQLLNSEELSETTAVYLSLLRQLEARRALEKNENITDFTDSDNIIEFAKNMLCVQSVEKVILVCLDAKCRLINADYISQGTASFANVMPADVSRRIANEKPKYVFVAHNHLVSTCNASFSDINFTINLSNWLKQFDIRLIDHIIVSGENAVSMAKDSEYAFIFD